MKLLRAAFCTLATVAFALSSACQGAEANEDSLIGILTSDKTLQEKDVACAQLKRVGTSKAIPALSALLADPQLSHSARYALEAMPEPAGEALLRAVTTTSGELKVGVINSLGVRREAKAVATLSACLSDSDANIVAASAAALGQIGGTSALKSLESAFAGSAQPSQIVIADAWLNCANRMMAEAPATARKHLQQLYQASVPDHVKAGAFRGLILCDTSKGLKLMAEALQNESGPALIATLRLVPEIKNKQATATLCTLLPKLRPEVAKALVQGLGQRADPIASPALQRIALNGNGEIQTAAVNALALTGGQNTARTLAQVAANSAGNTQVAARQALVQLQGESATRELLEALPSASPVIQAEIARALGERRDPSSTTVLARLASADGPAQIPAMQALAGLVEQKQLDLLVSLVGSAKTASTRAQAAEALNTACQRLSAPPNSFDPKPITAALQNGSPETQVALLTVCPNLALPDIRRIVLAKCQDQHEAVRSAARRALCDTQDPELLDALTALAVQAQDDQTRSAAVAGCFRLWSHEDPAAAPLASRFRSVEQLLALRLKEDQLRMVLGGLGEMPDPKALNLAEQYLENPAVRNEAGRAIVKLASSSADSERAQAAVNRVLASGTDAATHAAAQTALRQIEARRAYITKWVVAGPYRQAGKNFAALFGIPFAPEQHADAKWQPCELSVDPAKPFVVDLLKTFGGEQCAAYATTWVHSERPQAGTLELGSDDGIKVWVNGKLCLANNVARPIQPGSDKANVTLTGGWNELLLKVTQNNQGWEFCARLLAPDGGSLPGLRFSAERPAD